MKIRIVSQVRESTRRNRRSENLTPKVRRTLLKIEYIDNNRNIHNRYNSLFQKISFRAKEIRYRNFMPTFKVKEQIYHLIGIILLPTGQNPQFS